MEENTGKKLSYEELSKAASDLHVQYQKLMNEYQRAVMALQSKDFEYTAFFLQMLFKVMEHTEMYSIEFTAWASENIERILTSFAESEEKSAPNVAEEKHDSKPVA